MRRRLVASLRARLTAVFAVGALTLSLLLSVIAYEYTRTSLLASAREVALRAAYVNARSVRDGLRPGNVGVTALLDALPQTAQSESVVVDRGRWYASSLLVGRAALPAALRQMVVVQGRPARMAFSLRGQPRLATGVPLPEVGAAYFEIDDLGDVEATLRRIAIGLAVAAAATTVAGASFGRWSSRRLVRPIYDVATASRHIATGRLDTRLPAATDRELAVLTASFNDMADALQRRIARDARFAADVTHELRSPLTTLSAALQVLLARRDALPERGQQALELLEREVRRFERLVQDLLELARTDAGVRQLSIDDVRIGELVLRVCGELLGDDVPVQVEGSALSTVVPADKRRLERVVANLLDNARRHGGGAVAVRVCRVDGSVRVEIDDAGPGVAAGDRERIFERFSRGTGVRERGEGVGLGLALVSEHVDAHGGRVWVVDRPGGGARFVVELPTGQAG